MNKTIYIFRVTTTKKENWEGVADSFDQAVSTACKVFLCPLRSIKNVKIVNCTVTDNGRNNISVSKGDNIEIGNCYIYNAKRTAPKAGIDVEPDANETVKNISIHDNIVIANTLGIDVVVSNTPKVS